MKKKIFALVLVLAISASLLVSCSVTKTPVSVLWSDYNDEYIFTVADAIDRAFYNQNIKHYDLDAGGREGTQIMQAKNAIDAGAPALVVNPVSQTAATEILALAKAKNIPILFIATSFELADQVIAGYDKAAYINVDFNSLWETLGNKIADDIIADWNAKTGSFKTFDRNRDGKLSVATFGADTAKVIDVINARLDEAKKEEKLSAFVEVYAEAENLGLDGANVGAEIDRLLKSFNGKESTDVYATDVEIIVTGDDAYIPEMLMKLREYELNYDRLVTHSIPLYTVGISTNASELIADGKLLSEHTEPNKKGECANCGKIIEELKAYTVRSAVDNGYVFGAALENDDAIAEATSLVLRNLLKEYTIFRDVDESFVDTETGKVKIPYTIYG